ncbi:MAG: DUF3775 domain-containing protein [Novosphingobium sp.]|nr:DUF3775 domain-containing protein [Novosphingobium sp.]
MAISFGPAISLDKLCFIVSLAREFEIEGDGAEPETDSGIDEEERLATLEGGRPDTIDEELRTFIDELDEDEQIDLVALVWLGRDEGERSDWPSVRSQAIEAHNDRTADYLMGIPLLPGFLEDGMNAFGLSCET